jgi:hypothetical protein
LPALRAGGGTANDLEAPMMYLPAARVFRLLVCAGALALCASGASAQLTAAEGKPSAAEPEPKSGSAADSQSASPKKPLAKKARSGSDAPAAAGKTLVDPPKSEPGAVGVVPDALPAAPVGEGDAAGKAPPRKKRALAGAPEKRGKGARKKPRASASEGRQPTAEYRRLRDSWHEPVVTAVDPVAIVDVSGRVPLVIAPVNGGHAPLAITPQRDDGGFSDEDLERAARVFCPSTVRPHPIAPHLLDLVYRAMRHFEVPLVRLVSGYRRDRAGSRHTQGRALDMVLPGVTNEQLAEYLRGFGFVGVGVYPKSGFVHLDVRENSFFWVDNSLPDERSKPQPHLGSLAAAMDDAARARGEAPHTFVRNNDREDKAAARTYVRRAQRRRAAAAAAMAKAEERDKLASAAE